MLHNHPRPFWALIISMIMTACSTPGTLPPAGLDAIKADHQAYVDAWIANDEVAVLATLTDDAVLLPHHGDPPIIGKEAIRQWWFTPDAPPTNIVRMINTITEVAGHGDVAFVYGRSELEFTYLGKTYSNVGNYLSVMRKEGGGRWRISRRIWNDPVATVQ